jgi:hypothetical protein
MFQTREKNREQFYGSFLINQSVSILAYQLHSPGKAEILTMSNGEEIDWRQLCAQASQEADSDRLLSLVNQILDAFEKRDQESTLLEAPGSR